MHILNQLRWQLQLLFHNGHDASNIHRGPNSRPYFSPLLQILTQETQENILSYLCSPHCIIFFYLTAFHAVCCFICSKGPYIKSIEVDGSLFHDLWGCCNRPTLYRKISQISALNCGFIWCTKNLHNRHCKQVNEMYRTWNKMALHSTIYEVDLLFC